MPATRTRRWTADEARALNENNTQHWPRYEVIDGELLVSPAPRSLHQDAVEFLAKRLSDYNEQVAVGETMTGPADISLEPESTVSPDVFVTMGNQSRTPRRNEVPVLLCAAEVLSPSTARFDRVIKRAYFGRNGVPAYWVVDLDARLFECWRPGDDRPEIVTEELTWMPPGTDQPFVLDLPAFFAELWGESEFPQSS